jgi:hypothetical protein
MGVVTATGVVIVVVVTTALVGVGGGGAESRCDSGSDAQPAKRARTPQQARTGVICQAARAEAEGDRRLRIVFFIAQEYIGRLSGAMGCCW